MAQHVPMQTVASRIRQTLSSAYHARHRSVASGLCMARCFGQCLFVGMLPLRCCTPNKHHKSPYAFSVVYVRCCLCRHRRCICQIAIIVCRCLHVASVCSELERCGSRQWGTCAKKCARARNRSARLHCGQVPPVRPLWDRVPG